MTDQHPPTPAGDNRSPGVVPQIIPLSQLIAEVSAQLDAATGAAGAGEADAPATELTRDMPVRLGALLDALGATGAGSQPLGPGARDAANSILGHPTARTWSVAKAADRAITLAASEALMDEHQRRNPDTLWDEDDLRPHRAVIRRPQGEP